MEPPQGNAQATAQFCAEYEPDKTPLTHVRISEAQLLPKGAASA